MAGVTLSQLIDGVISGRNCHGSNPAMTGGMNIMDHVAHESRLIDTQIVVGEDFANPVTLVDDACVNGLKMIMEPKVMGLLGEKAHVHAGENEAADLLLATPAEHLSSVRKNRDSLRGLSKRGPKSVLQIRNRDPGEDFFVEFGIREAETEAEFLPAHRRYIIFAKDGISRMKGGRKIIDQSAGPVEEKGAIFHVAGWTQPMVRRREVT